MRENIVKATILVSIMTIINKPLGFIREAIIASYYGASSQTDAFFLAQNMPGLLFPAVCVSLSTAFLTLFISKSVIDGSEKANNFASSAITLNLIIAGILSLLAFIFSPFIVKLFAPGFDEETLILAVKLTRIVMSSFILLMLKHMLSAVLNSKKIYIGDQVAGIFYNITIIGFIILIGNIYGIIGLTWIFLCGYLVQDIVLICLIIRKFKFRLTNKIITSDTKKMLRIAGPILIGNSVIQINNIVDKMLASGLNSGSVSALSYSNTLNSFVIAIVITSLSTVLYPTMSDYIARDDKSELINSITKSISMIIIVLTPISIITTIYAKDVVKIAYGRGSFGEEAIILTSSVLAFYGLSYIFTGIREVVTKAFYAYKDTKTPMVNGIISVVLNIVLSIMLTYVMGISGIALGTTLALFIASILFIVSLKKKIPELTFSDIRYTIYKIIISSGIMFFVMLVVNYNLAGHSAIVRFIIATLTGFMIYFGLLLILKCKELQSLINLFKRKL